MPISDLRRLILILLCILTIASDKLTRGSGTGKSPSESPQRLSDVLQLDSGLLTVLEEGFLRKMGMVSKPLPRHPITIPEHLTELYEQMMDETLPEESDLVYDFDSAKSFFPEGKEATILFCIQFYVFDVRRWYVCDFNSPRQTT